MKREDFYIPSSNGASRVHGVCWKPEGSVRAVLQITHGMVEYIERYEPLARAAAAEGIAVIGHDHLGHGKTAASETDLGFFGEKDGDKALIKDIRRITIAAKRMYPGLPCFLLGHSMGSFYARRYITLYGREIDGVILMGTGWVPGSLAWMGWLLSGAVCLVRGKRYRSRLLTELTLGSYNRAFREEGVQNAWISRDQEAVKRYNDDPLCNFRFTASAYHCFFKVLRDLAAEKQFGRIPKGLPVLFLSGEKDPVGGFGGGVEKAFQSIRRLDLKDIGMKLYPEDRHELVNELDRERVYQDILQWLDWHI